MQARWFFYILLGAFETERFLMDELEHRVKNSLMLASSVLSIQKSRVRDREMRAVLDSAQGRILAIARAHDRLRNGADVSAVAFDAYLRGLCGDLAANAGFRYNVSAGAMVMPSSEAVKIGLIVTELLLNAAKHAGTDDVQVDVSAHATADQLLVTVRDNGGGVPDGMPAAGGPGLGMRIVNDLLAELNGELELENVGSGTLVTIRVPFTPHHQETGPDYGREADATLQRIRSPGRPPFHT